MTTNEETSMFQTWEFKGLEIKPLTLGRKNNIVTLIAGLPIGPTMFAMAVYGAICPVPEIIKGLRNPDWFTEKVTEWMESIELDQGDYEQLGTIFKELIENSGKNRAVPVTDPNMLPDPELGNG